MTKHGFSSTAAAPLNLTKSDTQCLSLTLSIHRMVVHLTLRNSLECYFTAGSCFQWHVVYDPLLTECDREDNMRLDFEEGGP